MSMRPLIYPLTSIEPLRKLIGSNDASLIDAITETFIADRRENFRGEPEAESIDEFRAEVTAVVAAKLPLAVEPSEWGYALRYAAKALRLSDTMYPINEDWQWTTWAQYRDEVSDRLSGPDRQALDWLVNGRPLVAPKLKKDGSYYAWLEQSEVESLLAALDALRDEDAESDEVTDEFDAALLGWLRQCKGRALLLTAS